MWAEDEDDGDLGYDDLYRRNASDVHPYVTENKTCVM